MRSAGLSAIYTFAVAALLATGCGPVSTASAIRDAEHKLKEARELEADKNAPYEYTKAASYLHKAKELEGYGLYEQASTFADRCGDMSEKAQDVARLASERDARSKKFGKKPKSGAPAFTPSGGK